MPNNIPARNYEDELLRWASESLSEGEAFLKAQSGYNKIQPTIQAIMGEEEFRPRSESLSGNKSNHIGKIALDLASGLTDTKPFWKYKTKNAKYQQNVDSFNKLGELWWTRRFVDLRFLDAIKYALAAGSGWCSLFWNQDSQDLDMAAEDPRDVIPIRPSSYISIQDALGVCVRRERTVNYLRAKYPHKASVIKADRDGSLAEVERNKRYEKFMAAEGGWASPFAKVLFNRKPAQDLPKIPTADLFVMYLKDDSLNKTGYDVQMGPPEQNWSYIVKPGEPLYPRGRCIEFTRAVVLYDGPNPYWHGLFPVIKLTLDPYPWTFLGKAPLWDLLPLQSALDRLIRVVDDHTEKYARPDLIVDKNATSKAALRKLDTRLPGLKMQHNPIAGKGLQVVYPDPLDQGVKEAIQFYIQEMNTLSGVLELSALSKLGQIPSTETVEKIMEAMTPAMRVRSRVLEVFVRDFAFMTLCNMMQFYTTSFKVQALGPQSLTPEDFDFDPGSLVPAYTDQDYESPGVLGPDRTLYGPRPRYDRSKEFAAIMSYEVSPGSLLNASAITEQLMYLQLARAGLIDNWTLLEKLEIPNIGEPPQGARTITERLAAQAMMGLGPNVSPVGRKASGQQMPTLNPSGGISESG